MNRLFRPDSHILSLWLGDTIALLVVVWIGFATHDRSVLNARWLASFLPLWLLWTVTAPWFNLYHPEVARRPASAARAALAALIATPTAMVLRSLILGSMVLPLFAIIMAASAAVGIAIWRLIWVFVITGGRFRWTR